MTTDFVIGSTNLSENRSALPQCQVSYDDMSPTRDAIDVEEIFEIVRHVYDPEHPLTLEQLKVVSVSVVSHPRTRSERPTQIEETTWRNVVGCHSSLLILERQAQLLNCREPGLHGNF